MAIVFMGGGGVNAIEIRALDKRFGETVVFRGLSLTLPPGAAVALMGASGAGKTTLLRLLAGLETPDAGTVSGLDGARVAMQFQEDRLIEYADAVENLRLALPGRADLSTARALLSRLLPGAPLDAPVSSYSGGMKRRVALARALIAPSELLLLDEPFTGLDDEARRAAAACVREYRGGRTLVMTTHDREDAELCGAEVIEISNGMIL